MKKEKIANGSLRIKTGLIGDVHWNTNLKEAPLNTKVLTTERMLGGEDKGLLTLSVNSRVKIKGKGDNCWWSFDSTPIAWSPIPLYDPKND